MGNPRLAIIGDCCLIHGDCREAMPMLHRLDVLVTDPPYGRDLGQQDQRGGRHGLAKKGYASYEDTLENFQKVIVPAIKQALAITRRGAVFCNDNLHELPKPAAIGGIYLPSSQGRHCWGFNSLSPIGFYGVAPGLNAGSRPSATWSTEIAEKNGHPCPKPLGWMKWLVSHASMPGEEVLDPFMGSGTTGVACVKLGRRFTGIEIDKAYFDIACSRIEEAYRQGDLFVAAPAPPATNTAFEF